MTIQELEKLTPADWFYDVKDQLKRFIYERSNEAFAAGDAARDAIKITGELESRQEYVREMFKEAIGGLPSNETPLNPEVVGTIDCDGFRIEKIIFESRPKTFVTANLYIPGGITGPTGAVLFLCGHHEQAKNMPEYQAVCQNLVRAGLIVLAQDPIGQGERLSYYEENLGETAFRWGTGEHDYVGSQCWPLGIGLARYFIHDAMRSIDYLCTRPEVDPYRIGVTGNSGGGTQTSLMMICDPRIAAAAPATFIMNRQTFIYTGLAQDSEQIWPGMTALGIDHEDILISMVPKPVLVLAAASDFFPIEGTRHTVKRTKRFWELYGKDGLIDYFEDNTTHMYTRAMAKKAAEFFSMHLLGRKISPYDSTITPLEPSQLWCTKSGQVRGEKGCARFVNDENLDRLAFLEEQRKVTPEAKRKEMALTWLRERVFYRRKPSELNPRFFAIRQADDFSFETVVWWAQEGILNYGILLKDYRFADKKIPITIAVWDGGTSCLQQHIRWIRETCSSGRAVLVLDVSGIGNIMPISSSIYPLLDFYGLIFKLAHDLIWLGDSLPALRTYDVIRAVDVVKQFSGIDSDDIRLYAYGRYGLYAQLAVFLDERVEGIDILEGMESFAVWVGVRYYDHYDIMSVNLPDVLKYFDLSDINKWINDKNI